MKTNSNRFMHCCQPASPGPPGLVIPLCTSGGDIESSSPPACPQSKNTKVAFLDGFCSLHLEADLTIYTTQASLLRGLTTFLLLPLRFTPLLYPPISPRPHDTPPPTSTHFFPGLGWLLLRMKSEIGQGLCKIIGASQSDAE